MAVKIKVVRASLLKHPVRNIALIAVGGTLLLGFLVCWSIFSYYYIKYEHIVEERLQNPFEQTAKIYAAPKEVRVGQKLSSRAVALEMRNAGYSGDNDRNRSQMGTYSLNDASINIQPGPQSYHSEQGATITFNNGLVSHISGDGGQALEAYELEPQLITGLSDQNRTKRRLVTYDELPPNLVNAVTSIEDRRFFEHGGVDYFRLLGALRDDLRLGRRREGGSTLTMQLARGFFLTPEKKVKRKIIEIAITFQLEHRYNKQQIFQLYANEIPLGQQGSFAINGFGQAAESYFGKDVKELDLAQCATAGRHDPASELSQPLPPSGTRRATAKYGARRHGGNGQDHQAGGNTSPRLSHSTLRPSTSMRARRHILSTWCATGWCSTWGTRISIVKACASTRRSIRICNK